MSDTEASPQGREADSGESVLWATRLLRRSLLDADGSVVGTVHDIVLLPDADGSAARLQGFVAHVDRRLIFVKERRVDAVDRDGVHLRGGTVDLRRFRKRPGEIVVAGDVIGAKVPAGAVADVGFVALEDGITWEARQIAIASGGRLRRRALEILRWETISNRFRPDQVAGDLATIRNMHKADAAKAIQSLPDERRAEVAAALEASTLADVLEELPEQEQAEILGQLEPEVAIEVLDEMEVDDEIDLLKELEPAQRESLLSQMPPEEVARLRPLLSYREDTAGGMMTPEPIIVSTDTTVAEAIARLRDTELPPALAARVFVVEEPVVTPTGSFLGSVNLPRLLRQPPNHMVGDLVEPDEPTLSPSTPEREVADLLARYDLLAVAVVDAADRLLGAVTVDDVLIRLVPRAEQ